MRVGTVAQIWRYPVKSLKGEALEKTHVSRAGLPHDRETALFAERGHYARTGKTYRGKEHNLLHTASRIEDARAFASERGVDVEIRSDAAQRFFDAKPVSLIVDRWIDEVSRALGETLDPLRWRPNFYVRATAGFELGEAELVGATLLVGSTVLHVVDTIGRCVTTTYDIETGEQNDDVLTYVALKRANVMGIYCEVRAEGEVCVGDAVEVRDLRTSRTTDSSASI
ncbi:MAG: MOSC domain-containing protein [Candidatus Eremiobacteraeota bacterium]|nr:MOSC domain-containing protein [Candidatus Eremiobacteraeota bacterium]